jgi:outer membrane protein, heavy metal efflux system
MKHRGWFLSWMLLAALAAVPAASQAPNAQTPPAPANRLRLDDLVAAALRSNPEIRAAGERVEALRARIPQAKALPDPTVAAGWAGKPAPFVVNSAATMSYRGVSAMETFPFPGKLKLRGEIAGQESQAAWWDYEAARRSVVSEVKVAYYQYAYFHQALGIIGDNQVLLDKLTKIAEARYEAGKGIQQDVLKGQLELSQLLERITILQEEEQTAAARINTLLDRDPSTPLEQPEPLAPTQIGYTLDELYRLAAKNDTGLARDQQEILRDQDSVALAHKDYDPDFTVNYMFQRMPGGPNLYGAQIGVNIPIFYKSKQRQEVLEATQDLASDRSERENRQTTLNYLVKEQFVAAEQAGKLIVLYSQAIAPQSSQALESSELAYETGKADFLTMLDNFTNMLDFQVNYYREVSDYRISLARLEPLVGVELTK